MSARHSTGTAYYLPYPVHLLLLSALTMSFLQHTPLRRYQRHQTPNGGQHIFVHGKPLPTAWALGASARHELSHKWEEKCNPCMLDVCSTAALCAVLLHIQPQVHIPSFPSFNHRQLSISI